MLEARLRDGGNPDKEVQDILQEAAAEMEQAKSGVLFDKIITNDDLEAACSNLEAFIYGMEEEEGNTTKGEVETKEPDVAMADAGGEETEEVNGAETTASAEQ